ncbi:hypothetical protein [Atrimonas thermophila]|uniref:hypothetical protein n=1 Tax=Atrimonas thermophila TaxID=3064161 RepID=UPI00399CCA42
MAVKENTIKRTTKPAKASRPGNFFKKLRKYKYCSSFAAWALVSKALNSPLVELKQQKEDGPRAILFLLLRNTNFTRTSF